MLDASAPLQAIWQHSWWLDRTRRPPSRGVLFRALDGGRGAVCAVFSWWDACHWGAGHSRQTMPMSLAI